MEEKNQNQILERIKKLLSRAGSSNVHEAKLAMEKVSELLIKYNLELQSVQKLDSSFESNELIEGFNIRSKAHHRYIWDLLSSFFFVNIMHTNWKDKDSKLTYKKVTMIGRPVNTKIALYVYEFLNSQYPIFWKEYRKGNKRIEARHRHSFYQGLTEGIGYNLYKSKMRVEDEFGLVVSEDVIEKYIEEQKIK